MTSSEGAETSTSEELTAQIYTLDLHVVLEQMERAGLGRAIADPTRCRGGAVHRVWHVVTDRGEYAIKTLDQMAIQDKARRGSVRQGETIARDAYKRGIPAVRAMPNQNGDVIWEDGDAGALIFPWVAGQLSKPRHSVERVTMIAHMLRSLYGASFTSPGGIRLRPWALPKPVEWRDLLAAVTTQPSSWASYLADGLPAIDLWSRRYRELPMRRPVVITHGDVVPGNVIWVRRDPWIIDWEFAGATDRDADVINTAIAWSFPPDGGIDADRFVAFWETLEPGTINLDNALAVRAARIVVWLHFDVSRWLSGVDTDTQRNAPLAVAELNALEGLSQQLSELVQRRR